MREILEKRNMRPVRYKCNNCGKIIMRDPMVGGDGIIRKTPRVWMNSFCEEFGKNARLYRVKSSRRLPLTATRKG